MDNLPDFLQDLHKMIENNELKLPTQPSVAVRIRECAEDPYVTPERLGKVINQDPGLTAKIMQIGNSPLMRGAVPISSLPDVISRLGLKFVCDTSIGLAMAQIFQATNETIDDMMQKVWTSSSYVAAFSHVIAKHYSRTSPGTAALAGLMHQIGVLPILTYAQDHDECMQNKDVFIKVLKEYHPKIGEFILTSWKFPSEITVIPANLYTPHHEALANLLDITQVAVFKTQDDKKYFLESTVPVEQASKHLKIDQEKLKNDEAFNADLQQAIQFYCHL